MKSYPSIPRSGGQSFEDFYAHVFDKLDGSNIRAEFAKKKGWAKFGTRTRLFDHTDPIFGPSLTLFAKWTEDLERIVRDNRWERAIFFFEFWGPMTLGGLQQAEDDITQKRLTLIDVAPYKQGLLGPKEFLKIFDGLDIPNYLGHVHWTRGYVESVRHGEIAGVTFEGVVGKSGNGRDHNIKMAKAKTQAWVDAILARYGEEQGSKLVDS